MSQFEDHHSGHPFPVIITRHSVTVRDPESDSISLERGLRFEEDTNRVHTRQQAGSGEGPVIVVDTDSEYDYEDDEESFSDDTPATPRYDIVVTPDSSVLRTPSTGEDYPTIPSSHVDSENEHRQYKGARPPSQTITTDVRRYERLRRRRALREESETDEGSPAQHPNRPAGAHASAAYPHNGSSSKGGKSSGNGGALSTSAFHTPSHGSTPQPEAQASQRVKSLAQPRLLAPRRSRSDIAHWAPADQVPEPSRLPHLPNWSAPGVVMIGEHATMRDASRNPGPLSSLPNPLIQRDIDFTLRKLMNEKVFGELVMDPLGRHRFREFLESEGDTAEIDLWFDTYNYSRLIEDVRVNGDALHDIYFAEGSDTQVRLPMETRREVMSSLRKLAKIDVSFESTQSYLLHSMYHHQFQRFVKHKIIQETHVKLGKHNLSEQEQEGLGDCFCLTNPRLPDHPIVLVSDGFVGVTGYPKAQIIGRNCRFLQGPGTAPESVQRIRDGLNSGTGCTELLLNYRRNGEAFYCLVCIIPLRDASGGIAYFIGGQTNVTGLLATEKNLGFLIGGEGSSPPKPDTSSNPQFSPTMALYRQQVDTRSRSNLTVNSTRSNRKRDSAAGSVDAHSLGQPNTTARLAPRSPTSGREGFFRNFLKRPHADPVSAIVGVEDGQVLAGAESMLNGKARPLEGQLALFQDTYNKIIIFKQSKREITFVTRQVLGYLGLPSSTPDELFSSRLINSDLASFLTGPSKADTKQLRTDFKDAIKRSESFSIKCGIKFLGKSKLFGRNECVSQKVGVMHLTPLRDRDGSSIAFIAVLG